MADETQTATGDKPPASEVEGGSPGGTTANAPAPVHAERSVPKFGGLRGGRQRRDGLVPGSSEALAADRKKDRDRKRRQRGGKMADPSPLPSAAGSTAATPQGPSVPLAGSPQSGFDPVGSPMPGGVIPWKDDDLKPIFEQLLPTFEELSVNQLTERASKANLPGEVVTQIGKDARWPKAARQGLDMGCPMLAAKYLNKSGVSSENKLEVMVGTSLATILAGHMLLLRKLDKLIESREPKDEAKGATTKAK